MIEVVIEVASLMSTDVRCWPCIENIYMCVRQLKREGKRERGLLSVHMGDQTKPLL